MAASSSQQPSNEVQEEDASELQFPKGKIYLFFIHWTIIPPDIATIEFEYLSFHHSLRCCDAKWKSNQIRIPSLDLDLYSMFYFLALNSRPVISGNDISVPVTLPVTDIGFVLRDFSKVFSHTLIQARYG